MATVSRFGSSRPVRPRLGLLGLEVLVVASLIFLAGLLDLATLIWFALVGVSVVVQSLLFYHIGRTREKLDR